MGIFSALISSRHRRERHPVLGVKVSKKVEVESMFVCLFGYCCFRRSAIACRKRFTAPGGMLFCCPAICAENNFALVLCFRNDL